MTRAFVLLLLFAACRAERPSTATIAPAEAAVPAALPAAGRTVLQAKLTERAYALVCATPGHAERAEFSTYAPGPAPLR